MLVNKSITATLMIERTDELKAMEKMFLVEERFIRKHKRNKWLSLFLNTFLSYYIASLFINITENLLHMIIASVFASIFSYVMQELADLRFIKFIRHKKLNINVDNFPSNTGPAFKNKISEIIDAEMKKERIQDFRARLDAVVTTQDSYQIDITYLTD